MLVRVTVIGATGRIDLALPGAVPVVSMVPDLTRLLGMETAEPHLVVTTTGAVLDANLGLSAQGIGDGAMLTVAPVREHVPSEVYDDVVDATHSLSREAFKSWGSRSAAVSSDIASAWLLGLGAAALSVVGVLHPQVGVTAGVVAGCGALALLIAAARFAASDTHHGQEWRAVAAAWFAYVYAALAAALAVTAQRLGAESLVLPGGRELDPMMGAALAVVAAAGVACVVLRRHRLLVAPPLGLGAVVMAGTLVEASGLLAAQHFTMIVATVVVLAARGVPGAALEATALRQTVLRETVPSGSTAPARTEGPTTRVCPGVDTEQLTKDLSMSHDLVLAVSLSAVGLLLLPVAPALTTGWVGLSWLLALTGVTALRLRRSRLHSHVVLGLVGVGLVLASIVVWSPLLARGLVVVLGGVLLGAGLLLGASGGRLTSVRTGLLGDRIEVALTAACVPLCVAVVWPTLLPGG